MSEYAKELLESLIDKNHPRHWLGVFDEDEVDILMAEVGSAFEDALFGEDSWDEFEAILHEWHESALAAGSQELTSAYAACIATKGI